MSKLIKNNYLDKENNILLKGGIPNLTSYKLSKIVRRHNSPFFNSIMRIGSTLKNSDLNFDNTMKIHIVLDNDIYYNEYELNDLENRVITKAKKDPKFLDRYFKKVINDCEEFNSWSKNIKDFKNLPVIYDEFIYRSLKLMSHLWPIVGPEKWILNQIEERLGRYINPKTNFEEFKKVMTLLTSSKYDSDVILRKKAILIGKDLRQVYEQYAWLSDQTLSFKYEQYSNFIKEVSKIKNPKLELKKIILDHKKLVLEQESTIKKYKLDKKLLMFCEYAQHLPHIRLLRRDCLIQAAYNLRDFFNILKKNLPISDLSLAYYWEIRELLNGKNRCINKIEKRKEGYSFIIIDHLFYEYDITTSQKIKNKIESSLEISFVIKGQIACMGKVTGKVKVLFSPKEINKINDGDILITSMTTPDYVPAMEKALAFVTDEGGLSCHAAIVAREMKKPCIIGTKIATKVFKDGDIVEVDAINGIIKKI
jgi:phosphohistidine swiveling domain-containing protein